MRATCERVWLQEERIELLDKLEQLPLKIRAKEEQDSILRSFLPLAFWNACAWPSSSSWYLSSKAAPFANMLHKSAGRSKLLHAHPDRGFKIEGLLTRHWPPLSQRGRNTVIELILA